MYKDVFVFFLIINQSFWITKCDWLSMWWKCDSITCYFGSRKHVSISSTFYARVEPKSVEKTVKSSVFQDLRAQKLRVDMLVKLTRSWLSKKLYMSTAISVIFCQFLGISTSSYWGADCGQFHQHFMRIFFVWKSFLKLFLLTCN